MMKRTLVVLLVWWVALGVAFSQSPYELNWKRELPYIGIGVATVGTGTYLGTLTPILTLEELEALNPEDVNSFDRIAIEKYSGPARGLSDVFLIGSHALPALFLTDSRSRSDFGSILALYGEAAAINIGITRMIKSLVRRSRPFVYNEDAPLDLKRKRNARTSFLSGHTSSTTVNAFFMAKVFSDFFPESRWKPVIWGTAIAVPAVTGYLRIAGGKHFPTDVIAGYALGATVGILVPQLHKNVKLKERGINLNINMSGAVLTWKFARAN